ncbi:Urease subunit alpha [Trichinella spiralis]|uniref:Urease subunit alpha n=1 Tax=Trichinella spiralis TaxID=6334 RepID=A0ABR3K656_TRISP
MNRSKFRSRSTPPGGIESRETQECPKAEPGQEKSYINEMELPARSNITMPFEFGVLFIHEHLKLFGCIHSFPSAQLS